ncbi:MAG: LysR family transcriptional regulator [Gammaproteobacteria bacterium]|nr:LysR family transcriptional regulator [Gammaproteobacteria bacterium]
MDTASLQHFEIFMAVADTASFTIAAKTLGFSKSAVSQTVKFLESSLKIPLFIRSTRKVELTDEGKLLFAQCQNLKNELELTRGLLSSFNAKPTGTLRISCNPYWAETKLLPILIKYQQDFPEVKIELITEERITDLRAEQIDIVFGVNWPAPLDIVARPIDKTRYVLCAAPQYFNKYGIPKSIKDLEQHQYINHLGRSGKYIIADLKNKKTIVNLEPKLAVNNAQLLKQFALLGLGIVQLHNYIIQDELRKGTLVEVLGDYLNSEIPLYMYYQKHRFIQPKIRQFINYFYNK